MNFKFRKMIYKIPGMHSFCVWIVTKKNNSYFNKLNKNNAMANKIQLIKSMKKEDFCFIVGNGPSLTMEDLEKIKVHDCFASNLIFKVFDKTKWRPKYYFLQDPYADIKDGLSTLPPTTIKFFGDSFLRKHPAELTDNAVCLKTRRTNNKKVDFSLDVSKEVYSHYTITYTMIQVAAYLGYKRIYLLGMDHNYSYVVDSKGRVVEDKTVKSHIFADNNPKEVVANLEGMNAAYIKARDICPSIGIEIFNSTRGGKLEWFPRKSLEVVFGEEEI